VPLCPTASLDGVAICYFVLRCYKADDVDVDVVVVVVVVVVVIAAAARLSHTSVCCPADDAGCLFFRSSVAEACSVV
jgi:hypothetical protein